MKKTGFGMVAVLALAAGPGFAVTQTELEKEDAADIARLCGSNLELPPEICDCMGDLAVQEFSHEGRVFLMALMDGSETIAALQRKKTPPGEVIGASMFLVSGPQQCMNQPGN